MKLLKYISIALLSLATFNSCNSDLDKVYFDENDVIGGELSKIAESYQLKKENADKVVDTIRWTASDFGYAASVIYSLEVDLAGKNFETMETVFSVPGKTKNGLKVKELNDKLNSILSKYKMPLTGTNEFEFRISATVGGSVAPVYYNIVKSKVSTYEGIPKQVYMIGDDFGAWTWSSDGIVDMIPVNGVDGAFWCIKYFNAGKNFKWAPIKEWGGDFNKLKTNTGFTIDGGNAVLQTSGLYVVYIDFVADKINIEPALVYGTGDCFGSWGDTKYPFAVDAGGKTMSITTKSEAELRIYAGSSIATSDWWTREFIILDGKIAYRGRGNDQPRVKVAAGSVVTLDFSNNTGTIK